MHLPPFLLDHWLAAHEFASPPIRYNLAASTGPAWSVAQLLALGGVDARHLLDEVRVSYAPPAGSAPLREQIAQLHGVDPDWVVVTTGASEALSALYCLAAEPGASIALPFPAFPALAVMARAWGLRVTEYKLARERGFVQTAAAVLGAVEGATRLALVNTPHNPTGAVMPQGEMLQLADALAQRGILLLVDEVYHPLYFADAVPSAAQHANTIVIGDLSKALSLSGLRIGWLIDRDARRRERLIDLRSYFTISGSPITEALAAHALAHRGTILARLEAVTRANLAMLEQFMHTQRSRIGCVRPAGGTVVFPWRLDGSNARGMCEQLARAGVLVAPGDCFAAPAHFRMGFGAQASGFQEALDIAAHIVAAAEPAAIT